MDINGLGTIYEIVKSSDLLPEQEGTLFSIIQNTPFIDGEKCLPYEISFDDVDAYGFLYSHFHNKFAISIPHDKWSEFNICVQQNTLCTETGKIISSDTEVDHVGDLSQFKGTWFEELIPIVTYSNSAEFIEYFYATYSKVTLSATSISYLQNLSFGKLRRLQRSLDILEKYCSDNWKFGNMNHSIINDLGLNARPESTSTMQQYGDQRVFKNEKEENETFSIHFDISEGERAYIKGVSDEKSIFVAYIGVHLSTKKFPK